MAIRRLLKSFCATLCSVLSITLLFSGCGKHEASSGALATGTGALVGASLAGDRHKGTGAILGALIGNYLGREVGKAADDEIETSEMKRTRERLQGQQQLAKVKQENRELKDAVKRWCPSCTRHVQLARAQRCPDCGDILVREKFCERCFETFGPNSAYRYCPYCSKRVLLSYR